MTYIHESSSDPIWHIVALAKLTPTVKSFHHCQGLETRVDTQKKTRRVFFWVNPPKKNRQKKPPQIWSSFVSRAANN